MQINLQQIFASVDLNQSFHLLGHDHDVQVFWNYWPLNFILPWFIRWPLSILIWPLTLIFLPHMVIWNIAPDVFYYAFMVTFYVILMILSALSVVFVWPFYSVILLIGGMLIIFLPLLLIGGIASGFVTTGDG